MLNRFPRPAALEAFYLLGGLVLVVAYRWFLDDAFIYYRYVDNFVFLDRGLVYNQGEYVEGFSSPLWTLLLIALRSLGLGYATIVPVVGIACFGIFGFALIALDRRLSPPGPRLNLPLAYLAFNYAVLSYFTSGTETPLVQAAAPLYALYVLSPASLPLQIAVGVSPLVRHEFALPLLLCTAWAFRKGVRPWAMLATAAGCLGAWGAFRVYYYADLFPNTFYLKDLTDVRQGLIYLNDTFAPYHAYAVAGLGAIAWIALRRDASLHRAERGAMLLAAASVALYVVKIGGDARHYRYLAFPFCLAVASLAGLGERIRARYLPRAGARACALAGVAVAGLSFSFLPAQLDRHPALFATHPRAVNKITDAEVHRRRGTFGRSRTPFIPVEVLRAHPKGPYEGVQVNYDCALAYQELDKQIVHSLGLTDAILARTDMPADKPGHKMGLQELAGDLARIQAAFRPPAVGMHRLAVVRGEAAPWIAKNLDAIEQIEQKIYNRHDLVENLKLAFSDPGRIAP